MRYIIKGGVWKNCEDEILKAAVMKYGLNQWSRISSLLIRKSAKQCKQRWYEWLDPQIKKTEWTREEDEKLLHLAKIFPCQWRTISPIVNRTPNQCVERYERLLDIAQGKNPDDPNDPRKLKPGEIDPNPETKPAKVDQIDMDEDQKEMLAEARVRLANTMGKKPKRLAREKLIEDARRQAQLQKRTELKAAGIEIIGKKRRSRATNYNEEIPFHRIAPQHVFQVGAEETPKPQNNFQNLSLRDIEGKQRMEEEENKRKVDEKRMKMLMEKNLGQVIDKMSKQTKEMLTSKSKLILPGVQLTDKDLEMLGKQNAVSTIGNVNNEVTKGLLGNYTQMTPTPMRTPRLQDSVMLEAKNLVALNQTQTPLLGGSNAELLEADKLFAKPANPTFKAPQTPNHLKKLLEDGNNAVSKDMFAAPASKKRNAPAGGQTPLMRDEFNLNDKARIAAAEEAQQGWEGQSDSASETGSTVRAQSRYDILKQGLQNLPKPQYEYEIEVPELEDEEEQQARLNKATDADDEEFQRQRHEQAEQQRRHRMNSLTISKRLPRPFIVPSQLYDHMYKREDISDFRREAEQMLEAETIQLLAFDSQSFPFQGAKPSNQKVSLSKLDENAIMNASDLIQREINAIKAELHLEAVDSDFVQSKWKDASQSIQINRASNQTVDMRNIGKDQQKDLIKQQAERNKLIINRESKRIEGQLVNKARVNLAGFSNMVQKRGEEIDTLLQTQADLQIELAVFKQLHQHERQSVVYRIQEMQNYHDQLQEKHNILQERYDSLDLQRYHLLEEEKETNQMEVEEQVIKQSAEPVIEEIVS